MTMTSAPTIDMNPRTMMHELAAALRDVIRAAPESCVEDDPEDAFIDLACSLVLRLSRSALTICPTERPAKQAATERTFHILTEWLREHPQSTYAMQFDPTLKPPFQFEVRLTPSTSFLFQGGDAQEAHAQAAQAIEFEALA